MPRVEQLDGIIRDAVAVTVGPEGPWLIDDNELQSIIARVVDRARRKNPWVDRPIPKGVHHTAHRLFEEMNKRQWGDAEIARRAGLTRHVLDGWRSGTTPDIGKLERCLNTLGLGIWEIGAPAEPEFQPEHGNLLPIVRRLFERMAEQKCSGLSMAGRALISDDTLRNWRRGVVPNVFFLEVCFNVLDIEIGVVRK